MLQILVSASPRELSNLANLSRRHPFLRYFSQHRDIPFIVPLGSLIRARARAILTQFHRREFRGVSGFHPRRPKFAISM